MNTLIDWLIESTIELQFQWSQARKAAKSWLSHCHAAQTYMTWNKLNNCQGRHIIMSSIHVSYRITNSNSTCLEYDEWWGWGWGWWLGPPLNSQIWAIFDENRFSLHFQHDEHDISRYDQSLIHIWLDWPSFDWSCSDRSFNYSFNSDWLDLSINRSSWSC